MIATGIGLLTADELRLLASFNRERALHYEAAAFDIESGEKGNARLAATLAHWRRTRADYFEREADETECFEAEREAELTAGTVGR